jgi:hypothetical protein
MASPTIVAPTIEEEPATIAIGSSGLKRTGGWVYEEWHPRLSGQRAVKVYTEMRDNDAVVGATLYVITALMQQVKWHVRASDHESEAAVAEAAFLEGCIEDMGHTWDEMMSEILTSLPFGWAYMETVNKRRDGVASRYADGRIGWAKIALRGQDTLDEWAFEDDGAIKGMWQVAPPTYRRVFIPMDRALLFRTNAAKNNPEGRSLLRNAYRSWHLLKRIQDIEGVGIERDLAGFPVFEVPVAIMGKNPTADQLSIRTTLETLVQKIRRDEREGAVIPSELSTDGKPTGYKLRLLSTGGRRAIDTDIIVKRYQQAIATTLLTQFLLLGSQSTGSFALASSQTDIFAVSLGAMLDSIESVFNRVAIPRLFKLNGVPEELWPSLAHGDIEKTEIKDLADYVTRLAGVGAITPDAELEQHLREQAELPAREMHQVAEAVGETLPGGGTPMPIDPSAGAPAPQQVIADTALNGAQIKELRELVASVASGQLPRDSGVAMIRASFPSIAGQAEDIMGTAGTTFRPATAAPVP